MRITRNGSLTAIESPDGRYLYYAKDANSPSSIWRVPVGGGDETLVVDGLSYSLNFVVADRGLYFIAVGDAREKTSLDFFDDSTGKRSALLALGKPFWYGTALSPDQRTMLYSIVGDVGSNLMVVDGFHHHVGVERGIETVLSLHRILKPWPLVDSRHERWARWYTQPIVAAEAKSRSHEWGLIEGLWQIQPR